MYRRDAQVKVYQAAVRRPQAQIAAGYRHFDAFEQGNDIVRPLVFIKGFKQAINAAADVDGIDVKKIEGRGVVQDNFCLFVNGDHGVGHAVDKAGQPLVFQLVVFSIVGNWLWLKRHDGYIMP
jgi:hypothetical protein